jgi:hypothetical protein
MSQGTSPLTTLNLCANLQEGKFLHIPNNGERSPKTALVESKLYQNPKTRFFLIVQQWQKPLFAYKNLLPNPLDF